jgi:hypothetical protein
VSKAPVNRVSGRLRYLLWGLSHPGRLLYRRRIVIAGLPKTGTTALYFTVKTRLPFAAGCFEPPDIAAALRPDEAPYVVKHLLRLNTPEPLMAHLEAFDRRVLLLRDPRDRLISSQLYHLYHAEFVDDAGKRERLLALLEEKERAPSKLSFHALCERIKALGGTDFFPGLALATGQFDRLLAEWGGAFHHLRYEDLVGGRLQALSRYLGLPLAVTTAAARPARRVLRTGLAGDWRNWLTPDDVARLKPTLEPFLERLGYGGDWRLNQPEALDPAHGSAYVRRLLAERDRDPPGPHRRPARPPER